MDPSAADPESVIEDECPICRNPLLDPCRPSACTHICCRQCLIRSLTERDHCPTCRAKAQIDNIIPAPVQGANGRAQMRRTVHRLRGPLPVLSGLSTPAPQSVLDNMHSLIRQLQATQAERRSLSSTPDQANQTPAHIRIPFTTTPRLRCRPPSAFITPPALFPAPSVTSVPASTPTPIITSFSTLAPTPTTRSLDNTLMPLTLAPPDVVPLPSATVPQSAFLPHSYDDNLMVRTFVCPFCQEGGMDERDLMDHCNENHRYDNRRVVCPVCVSLPHGNPAQHSRDFIGHLNLRHCYYIEDYANVHQSDMMNEQDAILDSYRVAMQNAR